MNEIDAAGKKNYRLIKGSKHNQCFWTKERHKLLEMSLSRHGTLTITTCPQVCLSKAEFALFCDRLHASGKSVFQNISQLRATVSREGYPDQEEKGHVGPIALNIEQTLHNLNDLSTTEAVFICKDDFPLDCHMRCPDILIVNDGNIIINGTKSDKGIYDLSDKSLTCSGVLSIEGQDTRLPPAHK